MNTQETILQLEGLKLKGMAGCYKALQQMPINDRPTLDQFVAQMAEAEQQYRNQRRTELYLKTSKLRYNAVLDLMNEYNGSKRVKNVVVAAGFPHSQMPLEAKKEEVRYAIDHGADEIDICLNRALFLCGNQTKAAEEISDLKDLIVCRRREVVLKVILETDLLSKDEIKTACELCIKGGADFVKTSTGFVKNGVGAKVEDVALMYETVKDAGLQVKASGGIRDRKTAIEMIEAGAVRLGTSSGVKIIG